MKQNIFILAGGLIALCLPSQIHAQEPAAAPAAAPAAEPKPPTVLPLSAEADFGPKRKWAVITEIEVKNFENETLGRVQDLTLDLTNGRIVQVLVVSDESIARTGGKTVAVAPSAITGDFQSKVYRINMSAEVFAAAPAFDLDKWAESTSPQKVAAAYLYFGQKPRYLVPGEAARSTPAGRVLLQMGLVERMSKLVNMNVTDLKGVPIGKLQSIILDVPNGRILNTYIQAPNTKTTPLQYSTIIPPTLLTFNDKRDTLLLDISKVAYAEQPHVLFQFGAGNEVISSKEETAATTPTNVMLVQGTSFRDVSTTAAIYKGIEDGKLDRMEKIEVGTKEGRVTLRGTVATQALKDRIGALAIAATSVANVDNQIVVVPPVASL